jgi:hypothetical protein
MMDGSIGERSGWVTDQEHWGKPFHVPAGVMHCAKIWAFTIFINWEQWRHDVPLTSAADDFSAV